MAYEWGQTAGYIFAGYGVSLLALGLVPAVRWYRLGKAHKHLHQAEQRQKTSSSDRKQEEGS